MKQVNQNHNKVNIERTMLYNKLCMDNQDRYKNVFIGYWIQFCRLKELATLYMRDVRKARLHRQEIDKIAQLMVEIQTELAALEKVKPLYDKHLKDSYYCKAKLSKSIKCLERIIADIDELVKGGHDGKVWQTEHQGTEKVPREFAKTARP